MKKFKVFKNGKVILEARFYSIDHVRKYLKIKYGTGTYEVQELSVYKDLDVKTIRIKREK